MIKGHGGNIYELAKNMGCLESDIIDMSSNLNPMGPMPGLLEYLNDNIKSILRLPEVDSMGIINLFAQKNNIDPLNILAANGTTQLIYTIPMAFNLKKTLIIGPTYSDYEDSLRLNKSDFKYEFLDEANDFKIDLNKIKDALKNVDSIFICNPNNPTGSLIEQIDLIDMINTYPDHLFVIDESYLPFVKDSFDISMINISKKNLIVLYSMSKIFSIPGLRLGFIIASQSHINMLLPFIQPWSVNSLAHKAAEFLLNPKNDTDSYIKESIAYLKNEKDLFIDALKHKKEIKLYDTGTSFVLIKLLALKSFQVCDQMANQKILIRDCSNFKGLTEHFIRVSLKHRKRNELLIKHLSEIIK